MKIGIGLGPWDGNAPIPIEAIKLAEGLGYDSVSTAETYGADALTPLAYIAAHTSRIGLATSVVQIDARTPANLAMCALSIDKLAGGGRVALGLGVSGPQIVEGWYGRPWGKPSRRLRDVVAMLRKIFRHEEKVSYAGRELMLPYQGPGSSGLGKPLKSIIKSDHEIPVLLGTSSPLNVRLTGEVADGWLGFHLVPAMVGHYKEQLAAGIARRTDGMTLDRFDVQATVGVKLDTDVRSALQEPKPHIALYAGGMGARTVNFHNDAMVKRGYGDAAARIQELFLAGRKEEAAAAVPDEYVDEEWLIGPPQRVTKRIAPWLDCGITTLRIRMNTPEVLELIATAASLTPTVNR